MSVENELHRLAERIRDMPVAGFSERQTEQYLVGPFLDGLGYDSRNPNEVQSQFPIQIGSTSRSCDYAVVVDGEVRVLVEVKKPSVSLDDPGQLGSYFSQVKSALLGIYTNGLEFRFYAERNRDRVKRMDSNPFLVLDLRRLDRTAISGVARCSKAHLQDAEGFQNWVTELGYLRAIHDRLHRELTGRSSDEFVRMAMSWAGVEVQTPEAISRFREIVETAASQILRPNTPESPPVEPDPISGEDDGEHVISLNDAVHQIRSWGRVTGNEMRKRSPRIMKFSDGTEVRLRAWNNVPLETAFWLYQNKLLTVTNCEVQDAGNPDWYILSLDGKHRDGRDFRNRGEPLKNTGIKMNKDLGAIRLMENAVKLLEHFGQDPSRVFLSFS